MGYDCYATLKPILEYKKFFFKLYERHYGTMKDQEKRIIFF